jgi:hypothetical protein
VPASLPLVVERKVLNQQRPRPDQRHVAPHDIPEFRQLVETGGPKESAQTAETFGISSTSASHGAELGKCEQTPMKTWASLPKQNRSTHKDQDQRRNKDNEGHSHQQGSESDDNI